MVAIITPKIDIVFKKLFGVEENKDLLISLINSVVSKEDQIAEVEILNPYIPGNFKDKKLSILDIKAKGNTGKYYNIEIQINDEADYDKRALHYWAKLYADQLAVGDPYSKLNKTIGIHILYFTSIPGVEKYHNVFYPQEAESKLRYFKDMELHTIELNKFGNIDTKEYLNTSEALKRLLPSIKTSLDRWVTFLGKYELLDRQKLPQELKDPCLEKALQVVEVMAFTMEERERYEAEGRWLSLEASALEKAEAKGMAKGMAKGVAEGIAEGEARNQITTAKNMLAEGIKVELIAKVTRLSPDQVSALKEGLTFL